jgi:hypothetical protein
MDVDESIQMDAEEVDALLDTGGTGVISLSSEPGEPPHSVPVSYGYDPTESTFYFRLAVGEDSEKGHLDGRAVSFVVHEEGADGWQSVVAQGRLEDILEKDIAADALAGLERVHIPLVDIFGTRPDNVDFQFLRLVPDELTGRTESSTAA